MKCEIREKRITGAGVTYTTEFLKKTSSKLRSDEARRPPQKNI